MRCRVGDLAVIVDPRHPKLRHLIGRTLTVTRLAGKDCYGDECWFYSGPRLRACGLICESVPDCWLKPLRDGDGQDETLTWRDTPQPIGEPA